MATTKKTSDKSPTPKSKAPAKKSAATTKKSTAEKTTAAKRKPATRRSTKSSKGIVAKTKDAVVEAVSTVVGGAVAGAAAAGTKLMEEKTGSVKKSVEKEPAGTTKTPAKKKRATGK